MLTATKLVEPTLDEFYARPRILSLRFAQRPNDVGDVVALLQGRREHVCPGRGSL